MAHLMALPKPDRLRVLAADSTAMGTQLLVEALARDAQFDMIESPSNKTAILNLVQREKPQVVVISAKLGEDDTGGLDLLRNLRTQSPSPRVVMLLDASERTAVIEAFRAGAQGVFCRTEPFRLLAKCIQCVDAGQVWASSSELQFVLEALTQPALAHLSSNGKSLLSAREIDVVRCLAEGLTNREIARRLKLTEHTVKNYLFRIFDKLGVSSRVEVVLYALGGGATHAPKATSNTRRGRPAAFARAKSGVMSAGIQKDKH
jgi:two-component system, NarL family, nitrate/nitrite response regulator NarL